MAPTHLPGAAVALATAREVADLDDEGRLLVAALAEEGVGAVPAVWDDPAVDWSAFALVVVRSTWDYPPRRAAFLAWADHVAACTRLQNPPDVLRWTTDKHYLDDLADAGLPVVPTTVVEPGATAWTAPAGELVVKPAVSAGSKDAGRYAAADREEADGHVRRLLAAGRSVLVQPYLHGVDDAGETAVVAVDGAISHSIRKGPILRRGAGPVTGLFAPEDVRAREASDAECAVARAALDVVAERFGAAPLYARVDLLADDDGSPLLLELEMAEPSLFLDHHEPAAPSLAAAIARRVVRL